MADKVTDAERGTGTLHHDPIKLVLSIPLLLEKILTELDNETFYNSRLVSCSWNIAALAIFTKRPIKGQETRALLLHKLFKSSEINPNFDVKLAKVVEFNESCSCRKHCRDDPCISTRTKFLDFWAQYSNQIESMKFRVFKSFIPTFLNIMSSSGKNLKMLSFDTNEKEAILDPENLNLEQQFSRLHLHTIKLTEAFELETFLQGPMQTIISGAPNLKRLELGANFYPDLSNNKKLQYLSHIDLFYGEFFNLKKLSRMFEQVEDSLETLKLKTEGHKEIDDNIQEFNFPRMPKLKKLVNYDISLQPMQNESNGENQTLFEICNSKFPSLVSLKIQDPQKNGVQNFFDKLILNKQIPQEKIVTLVLHGIQKPSVLVHFKNWFPNLKKLDLKLLSNPKRFTDPLGILVGHNFISSALSNLTQLGLKQLVFRIDFKFFLADLVTALTKNMELFKGLSTLELHANYVYLSMVGNLTNSDHYKPKTKFFEWLVDVTKSGTRVVFHEFSFSGEASWELMHFIRERNLPVTFVNKD